jgi:putative transposase
VLERLAESCGLPKSLTVDNDLRHVSKARNEWAYRQKLQLRFIQLGKLQQNAYIENFNGKFRNECLNEHWFISMRHAREMIETRRHKYNDKRPHSSPGYLTPNRFADNF